MHRNVCNWNGMRANHHRMPFSAVLMTSRFVHYYEDKFALFAFAVFEYDYEREQSDVFI